MKMRCQKALLFCLHFFLASTAFAGLTLHPVSWSDVPGWTTQNTLPAFRAYQHSCAALHNKPPAALSSAVIRLTSSWYTACQMAKTFKPSTPQTTRTFFEDHFQVYQLDQDGNKEGLLTGYYLPEIPGSLHKTNQYTVPIYARPRDLVTVRLDWFSEKWKNQKIAGRVKNGRLYPYGLSRKAINNGALKKRASVIAYVHSRAERFFLQVQGSGVIRLGPGKKIVLGYDGENGFPYYAIGKWFVEQHRLPAEKVSMQQIMAWLNAHPKQASNVLALNPSFIFFKRLPGDTVYGTDHIPLTPGYSLAVDSHEIPLGLPLYVASTALQRLLVTQDTGGAIRGALRGDVYWGQGEEAALRAGHMREQSAFYLLLPKI